MDFEEVTSASADQVFDHLRSQLPTLKGTIRIFYTRFECIFPGQTLKPDWVVEYADEYRYVDPVDFSVAERQGENHTRNECRRYLPRI